MNRRFFQDHYHERSLYRSNESIDSYSDESGHCSDHQSSAYRRPCAPSSADSQNFTPATRHRVLIVLTRCAGMMHAYDGHKQQPETSSPTRRNYCLDSVSVHAFDVRKQPYRITPSRSLSPPHIHLQGASLQGACLCPGISLVSTHVPSTILMRGRHTD
jgi:hypothetical protein